MDTKTNLGKKSFRRVINVYLSSILSSMRKERLDTFHQTGSKIMLCSTMCKVSWIEGSMWEVESMHTKLPHLNSQKKC